ncbi:MAG TPA: transporter substrate-binding domain-containing protein [Motiliproteus sp.]
MRKSLRLLLCPLWLVVFSAPVLAEQPLRACADDAQWPPFSYRVGDGPMIGFTIDLLRHIFQANYPQLQIDPLPWKRCLAVTESGEYQIAIDASANPERLKTFRLSEPYYQLSPYYFYSKLHFPAGLAIKQGRDLVKPGPVCGILGYSYSEFALGDTPIVGNARDFHALVAMLHRGRCASFIARYEIVAGMGLVGTDLLTDNELGYAPIPDAEPDPFYLLISRNIPHSESLKREFDQGLARMRQSGELQRLRAAYP